MEKYNGRVQEGIYFNLKIGGDYFQQDLWFNLNNFSFFFFSENGSNHGCNSFCHVHPDGCFEFILDWLAIYGKGFHSIFAVPCGMSAGPWLREE